MTGRKTPAGFWAAWTAVAVDLLGFGIVIPLLPLYADRYGADPFTIGLLFASYSLAQFLFSPIWGRISDRYGRKPVLLITIAGSAIGSLVLGLAGTIVVLFVGRIIDGISGASVAVARAVVADVADPDDRPRLMGLLGAAFGIGFVVGPALGGLTVQFGPSVPFFVASGISVVNLVAAIFRLAETRTATSTGRPARPWQVNLPGMATRLVIITFVGVTAFSAFETTFALLGDARFAMTESVVAWVFAGIGLVLVITQGGLVGPITRVFGETGAIRLGLFLNVVGFAILAGADRWAVLIPALALLALGQGLLTPVLSSAISNAVASSRAGEALGVQQSAGGMARVVGPLVGGALFAMTTPAPYVFAAGLTALVLPIVPASKSASSAPDHWAGETDEMTKADRPTR